CTPSRALHDLASLTSFVVFFLYCSVDHRDLHSFPTRRSSDLSRWTSIVRAMYGRLSGAGMFVYPHGFYVDKDGNIWATDGQAKEDRKSTRLNSSHVAISYAVFCLKKKKSTTAPCISLKRPCRR